MYKVVFFNSFSATNVCVVKRVNLVYATELLIKQVLGIICGAQYWLFIRDLIFELNHNGFNIRCVVLY